MTSVIITTVNPSTPAMVQAMSSRPFLTPNFVSRKLFCESRSMARRGPGLVYATADAMNTVKIVVQGRHMQVTPAIREYAESKVNKVRC